MEQTDIYALYDAFHKPEVILEPIAYYKITSAQKLWGQRVKEYNKKDYRHRAYYKANNKGEVIEAAFKEPGHWWQVFKKIIPPKQAYIIDASKIDFKF
jgi:hypothetical protein